MKEEAREDNGDGKGKDGDDGGVNGNRIGAEAARAYT